MQRRRQLKPAERVAAAQGLRQSLEQLPEFLTDTHVAGYWATGGELPLNMAIAPMAERGQTFYLPIVTKSGGKRRLTFAPWTTGEDVEANEMGIPEPKAAERIIEANALDLVLVPLLGFDRRGTRLGFGGGYYDRSFEFLRGQKRPAQPLLVGVAYAFQELDSIETAEWDISLDYVATDKELIDCTGGDAWSIGS